MVASIAEAKLKATDILAATKICSLLHQRYADFTPQLISALLKIFAPPTATETDQEKNSRTLKKRTTFRLLSELLIVGILREHDVLLHILQDLIAADQHQITHPQLHKDKEFSFVNLPLILSFVRGASEEIFGIQKSHNRPVDEGEGSHPS